MIVQQADFFIIKFCNERRVKQRFYFFVFSSNQSYTRGLRWLFGPSTVILNFKKSYEPNVVHVIIALNFHNKKPQSTSNIVLDIFSSH